jgi:FkbM family methyltransferase
MYNNRNLKAFLKAIVGKQHYIAFFNMYRNYPKFLDNLLRYLTGSGDYPHEIEVRTPTGIIKPTLYSPHDILTVNEIFCRLDYFASNNVRVIVDLGSNIGISALYFLSRNCISKCYLYEPDLRNTEKLKKNLSDFEERYYIDEKAVSYESGIVEFGIEPSGRYGGVGVDAQKNIQVECLDINQLLGTILEKEDIIDILKIDTEGLEIKTVAAIKGKYLKKIRTIYLEAHPQYCLYPDEFLQKQYGSVCQLINKRT